MELPKKSRTLVIKNWTFNLLFHKVLAGFLEKRKIFLINLRQKICEIAHSHLNLYIQ